MKLSDDALKSSQLEDALKSVKLRIIRFDPVKPRPVVTNRGAFTVEKFSKALLEKLGSEVLKYPELFKALHSHDQLESLVEGFVDDELPRTATPPEMEGLTLNMNLAAKGRDEKFFLTHADETVARISGDSYLLVHQMSHTDAAACARKVIPDYVPRGPRGVYEIENEGKVETVFNVYTPPPWTRYEGWDKLPDKLPLEFKKLVEHLFPIEVEREYFFAWFHDSLFKRALTFLILCGAPGTGKNRLKLVMRAVHGHVNTVDGKKSTLTERFNSQLVEATLGWFDELHYDYDMENTMKELQNDSISIERKGVDATRATRVHSSIVISNNKARDNYIAFDARKFAPLIITGKRLEQSMTPEEIDTLTQKVEDQKSETFDIAFVAQIAKWIQKHGRRSRKWPHLEYRGPMFWALAHTSMTRWQKRAAQMILEPDSKALRAWADPKKGLLWSAVSAREARKHGERISQLTDYTTVRAFFEVFRDKHGRKAFETTPSGNIMGDFHVRQIFKNTELITEATVAEQRNQESEKGKKETYDL